MTDDNRWLLPEGIEELLPQQAEHLERLRRRLLDLFHSWGYELVVTPLMEYVDSLLIGTGEDLDLQTFKIIDQMSGRLMGVRADMTPQVARIDAHRLKRTAPSRLCYVGAALRTRPSGFSVTRSPIQVGAELYGHGGIESDVEVMHLMVETLAAAGVADIYLDVGHVGIFRVLASEAGLHGQEEVALFDAMQRKAKPDMEALLSRLAIDARWHDVFMGLVDLNGDRTVLADARRVLAPAGEQVHAAIDDLEQMAAEAERRLPHVPLHFDLAELRGYHYKTGAVFAAFVPGHGQEVARGGRYDEIGKVFGRARPATGFSAELNTLIRFGEAEGNPAKAIVAPCDKDSTLQSRIAELRAQGERVICELPGQQGDLAELGCDRRLVQRDGQWQVVPITADGH